MEMLKLVWMAFLLDLILGDPRWMPHPVSAMGWVIAKGEAGLRKLFRSPPGLRVAGSLLTVSLVGGVFVSYWAFIRLAGSYHPMLAVLFQVFFISQCLAVKSLGQHALAVWEALTDRDHPRARLAVAKMVGRDTALLDEGEISRAAIESVAESTVDGIISPLFFAFLGGAPLAMAFKAVSTLDSSIGYLNDHYRDFGWAAAWLDDIANYIPARLTGLCFLLLAPMTAGGLPGVAEALWRDSGRHLSPNSGIPEAATAGALGIQLGGTNCYGGVPSHRATMGRAWRPIEIADIRRSLVLMLFVTLLFLSGMTVFIEYIQVPAWY